MILNVTAEVRRVGAIGRFYPVTFRVTADSLDRETVVDAWLAANCETWELHHIHQDGIKEQAS